MSLSERTGIAFPSIIARASRSKGTALDGIHRVSANGIDLLGKLQGNGLVRRRGTNRSWVLVLRDGGNLRVHHRDGGARVGLEPDLAGIALQSAVDEGGGHASHVVGGFGICKCLVGGGLLEAFGVCQGS